MIPVETVNMHILSREFESGFAVVEGVRHLCRSLAGMMGEHSIFDSRIAFLKFVREEERCQEKIIEICGYEHTAIPYNAVIYGDGGWNRYIVLITGEVTFGKGGGETRNQYDLAREVGFRVWPTDFKREGEGYG